MEAAIRATLDTYRHPTSSAPMGRAGERWAVVDLEGGAWPARIAG
ncbi:hypothetical protein P4123_11300 [Pseudomonas aeruginosa]|nr:hypothetical protein [Pseudomonas aeruginosa]